MKLDIEKLITHRHLGPALSVAVTLALAWSASLWANLWLADLFGPPPQLQRPDTRPADDNKKDHTAIVRTNIFNPSSRSAAAPRTQVAAARPSKLNYQLMGTIIDDLPEQNAAVLMNRDNKRQELFRVGQEIQPGVTVIQIDRFAVYVDNNGSMESLTMEMEEGFPTGPARSKASPSSRSAGSGGQGVRQVGGDQMVVDRGYFEGQLKNMSNLLVQVRALPHKNKDGKIDGFSLFQIQKGSVYEKLGLENGDVIKSVNGHELDSAEKGLQLFTALKSETRFQVELERNNAPKTMNIEIQ